MVQAREAHVQCQDHPQHKLEPGHRGGEPLDRDMFFNELAGIAVSPAWWRPATTRRKPIFIGFGVASSAPCLADVFVVCSFLFVTIWVAPENWAHELRTRDSTVLTQDSQGSQMVGLITHSTGHQISCISQLLPLSSDRFYEHHHQLSVVGPARRRGGQTFVSQGAKRSVAPPAASHPYGPSAHLRQGPSQPAI